NFFFQAEDDIRDFHVTGVQTCALPISTMSDGQRAVSTGTLNTPGRMGSVDSEIYICNAAVLAASALEGRIADPRPYLAEALAQRSEERRVGKEYSTRSTPALFAISNSV